MMLKASWVKAIASVSRTLTYLLMGRLKVSLKTIGPYLLFSWVCAVMKQKYIFKISQDALLVWVTNQFSFSFVELQVLS